MENYPINSKMPSWADQYIAEIIKREFKQSEPKQETTPKQNNKPIVNKSCGFCGKK